MQVFFATGRLVYENEIEYKTDGTNILKNVIAIKRSYKNKQTGEYDADFINITAFGQTAKYLAEYTNRGDLIEIKGTWQHHIYKDENGKARAVDNCVVENASKLSFGDKTRGEKTEKTNEMFADLLS